MQAYEIVLLCFAAFAVGVLAGLVFTGFYDYTRLVNRARWHCDDEHPECDTKRHDIADQIAFGDSR